MNLELPPRVTLHGQPDAPPDAKFGDLWYSTETNKLYRKTLGPTCPTCRRPGPETWAEVPGGLASLERKDD